MLDLIEQIVTADTADHAGIRLRVAAAIEGYADLPRGGELERIAGRAHVNRVTAYRARKNPPGLQTANTSTYPSGGKPVKPSTSEPRGEVA